jgi:outer membrane protein insertion porin family
VVQVSSAFNDVDYNNATDAEKYKFIEYHKWKFSAQSFTPLSNDAKLILMSRAEYGFLGAYNESARSPFERFNLGGDGLSGYNLYGSETVGLRGYENGALTYYDDEGQSAGNIYTRLTMELRYPLMLETSSTIYALAFVEAGRSWGEFKDFNPFELKRAAGAGVRIFLPMFGMMGIDWAYGFDQAEPRAGDASGSQFHFIIGQQF